MQSGKNRLCRPITSAKSSIPFGHATKMEKNPRLTYVLSRTAQAPPPPQKLRRFNAFKSGHPYGCRGSLHTDATFIPFLKFCYSTAHTFLGPLRSAHRGLSRLTFCKRSPRLLCPWEGREDPSLTFCSSFIKLELSFVL